MATINLLPWREEHRQQRKKEFLNLLLTVCVLAGLCAYAWVSYVQDSIADQNSRNQLLEREIASLEKKVAEIRELKKRRTELIDRMSVIQDLQGKRPVIVRYFDDFVRAIPDGVYINSLERNGDLMSVEGVSESNNRVSALMRRLDASDWFTAPNLNSVKAAGPEVVDRLGEQANHFKLFVSTSMPEQADENAATESES